MALSGWSILALVFIIISIILVLAAWFSSPQSKFPILGSDKQSMYYSAFFFLLLALVIFSAIRAGVAENLTGFVTAR